VEVIGGIILEFQGVVCGGTRFHRKHVHANGGFPNCPEPVTLRQIGFGQKRTSHLNRSVPIAFDSPILRVTMRGGGTNPHSMRTKETTNLAMEKSTIKITAKTFGETPGIDKETPQSIH
jgi:hypothetical protein